MGPVRRSGVVAAEHAIPAAARSPILATPVSRPSFQLRALKRFALSLICRPASSANAQSSHYPGAAPSQEASAAAAAIHGGGYALTAQAM